MSTIPDYPVPARPLTGEEPVAAWQDGKQVAVSFDQVAEFRLSETQAAVAATLAPLVATATGAAATATADAADAQASRVITTAARDSVSASQLAIAAAIAGYPNGATLTVPTATRGVLAAIASPAGAATLFEKGHEGDFVWMPGDQSALVSLDTQQAIAVAPASAPTGANGAWLRVFQDSPYLNVKWLGAKGDGFVSESTNTATGTNDTLAIQRAVDLAYALGIIDIVFPNGVYILSSGFTTTGTANAQIVLPFVSSIGAMATIRFRGVNPPALSGATNRGAILMSTDTAGLGAGVISSVIGCRIPAGVEDRNWLAFYVQDMIVRTPQNTPNSGIDARYLHQFARHRVRVDVIGGLDGNGPNGVSLVQPQTPTSYGVLGGLIDLPIWNTANETLTFGYYNGEFVGELTGGDDVCVSGCRVGMVFPPQRHPSKFGRVLILTCARTIWVTGKHETSIEKLDIEHTPLPAGWDARTYDIDDPNDYLRGEIRYHIHEPPFEFLENGGNNVKLIKELTYAEAPLQSFNLAFDTMRSVVSRSGLEELIELRPDKIPWKSFVTSRTALDAALGITSYSNFAAPGVDRRVAQHAVLLDGAVNTGKHVFYAAYQGTLYDVLEIRGQGDVVLPQKGIHLSAPADGDMAGKIALAGAASVTKTFARPMAAAPVVNVTPQDDLGAGVRYWVTTTTTGFTITASAVATATFSYVVIDNPVVL